MFQVFPLMKPQFSQISLPRLSQILPDPQPPRFAADIDIIIQSFFDNDLQEDKITQCHRRVDHQPFEKKEFFQILNKPFVKILKREQKKIEELILHHSRPSEQAQLNRIRLDKILKECFLKIQNSAKLVHNFICFMERNLNWQCICKKKACDDRQNFVQFYKDIFGFFYRSSKIINRQIDLAIQREVDLHPAYTDLEQAGKEQWKYNNKPGELILQIQNNCDLSKPKKKKRNKKNKDKTAEQLQQKLEQIDQDEKLLCNLMQSLNIEKCDRVPCIVTQQWLQKISPHRSNPKE